MKFSKFIFLFLAIFIFSACAANSNSSYNPNSSTSASLEPQSVFKFSDIPVPAGLKNLQQSSYSFESSGIRVGVLRYYGKADADRVISFYKEQMPMHNWNLVNIIEYGQRLINFERENESCIITLEPKGKNVILTVSLGPKSTVLAKKSRSPIK